MRKYIYTHRWPSLRAKGGTTVLFTLVLFLNIFSAQSQTVQTFNTTGTWTCPSGVTSVSVECWGGGGAGGTAQTKNNNSFAYGGGGAGGAYVKNTSITVVPGTTYTVTVGAQVSSYTGTTDNSVVNGNPSWFSTAATIYAPGGAGGVSRNVGNNTNVAGAGGTGSSTGAIGTTIFAGGSGGSPTATGTNVPGGGGGSSAGTGSAGNNGTGAGVAGTAPTGGAAGGAGGSNTAGTAGTAPGGGGGGASSITSNSEIRGGAGAAGRVVLTYNLPATNTWTAGAGTTAWATAGNWSLGTVPTATNNVVIASAAFQPLISAAATCNNLTLNSSTTLTINSTLAVGGDWTNNSNSSAVSGSGTVTLSSSTCAIGGTASTAFPNLTVTGSPTQGINTTVTGNFSQTGGVYVVTAGSTAYSLTVGGNFDMSGTAQFATSFNSATAGGTVTVTGNTTINVSGTGGIFLESNSAASSTNIFQTNGNVSFSGSSTNWIDFGYGTPTNNEFRVKGNFSTAGSGNFYTSSSSAAKGIVFNGTGTIASPQTLSYGSSVNSSYCSYVVNSGTAVQLLAGLTLSPSNANNPASSFTVNGTVDTKTFTLTGGGTSQSFALNAGATLVTANTAGVKSGTTGSISTAITSTFSSTANYYFNGTANQTANFSTATMNDLTVSNTGASGSNTVTLNAVPTVNGTLAVSNGILDAVGFQIIGNATYNFTLAAGTTFRMSAPNANNFPTLFTSAHCIFNASSTTEYYGTFQTVSATPTYGNLTITTSGTKTAAAALTVVGDMTINTNATFDASTFAHTFYGNWINNGTFTYNTSGNTATATFTGSSDATISGSSTTGFYSLTINKGTSTSTNLNITGSASCARTLTFTNGLLRVQTGGTFTSNANANPVIASTSGVHVNGGTATFNGTSLMNNGLFRLTTGTANIGSVAGNSLHLLSGSTGDIQGGTFNSAARIEVSGGSYTQSNGTITLCTIDNTSANGAFYATATGNVNISGGTMIFRNPGTNATPLSIEIISGGTKTITGGTMQIGDGSTANSQTFGITSAIPVYNFTVNGNNTPAVKLQANFTVSNTLTMNGGNIDANGNTLYVSNSATAAISRSAGFVIGNLKRALTVTGSAYLWPVGFTGNYIPVSYTFTNLTAGDLTVKANSGDQSNLSTSTLDNAHSVNAYWTVTASNSAASTNYAGTYTYPSSLLDATTDAPNFMCGIYNSGWSYPTVSGTPTTTSFSMTASSILTGDHAIAKCKTPTASAGSPQTICAGSTGTLAGNQPGLNETGAWSIQTGPNTSLSQFSDYTQYNSTFTPTITGNYILRWTITTGAPCYVSVSTVQVIQAHDYATAGTVSGTTPLCVGNTTTYTNSGAVVNGGTTVWSSSNTAVATVDATTGVVTAVGAGTTNIIYTVTPGDCGGTVAASKTLTVYSQSVAPTAASASPTVLCVSSSSVHLTASGGTLGSGASYKWYTDAGYTVPVTPSNSSTASDAALDVTVATTTTFYVRIEGGNSPCSTSPTTGASVTVSFYGSSWIGSVSTDWFTAANWCGGTVPTSTTNITIGSGATYYPVISAQNIVTGNARAQNITINNGGSITVNGTGGISIYGTVNNAGTFDARDGTIQLAAAGVTLGGSQIVSGTVTNFIISAGGNATIKEGATNMLYVKGKVSFANSNNTLITNDNLTLVSSATTTASLADITNNGTVTGNSVSGKAVVEKYVKTPRRWQLLSPDATYLSSGTATVQNTWMEGQAVGANAGTAGYGMWITGVGGQPNFDASTTTPTMKWWNGSGFTGIVSKDEDIHGHSAYMTFVRGDRSNTGTNAGTVTSVPTVLRTTGSLHLGNYPTTAINIPAFNDAIAIGNPYASAIDLRGFTTGVTNSEILTFYTWDPNLAGTYGLGAYQTITGTTGSGFTITPGGGSYTGISNGGPMNTIESGQAFFVQGAANTLNLQFNEKQKSSFGNTVSFIGGNEERIGCRLYSMAGGAALADGFLVKTLNNYNSNVDLSDARKMVNTNENISVKAQNTLLSVEYRKPVTDMDTVFINMTGMRATDYQWMLDLENMDAPGRTGFLVDKAMGTETALNLAGTSTYNFSVVLNGVSNAANRFMIVFKQAAVVPVKFVSINAYREKANIRVDWKVTNEINIHHYTVERSPNGVNFSQPAQMASVLPTNNAGGTAVYTQLDTDPLGADNYFRIRGVSVNGHIDLSAIVKVGPKTNGATIAVVPNPVKGNVLHIVAENMEAGNYRLQLIGAEGRIMFNTTLALSAGRTTKDIPLSVSQGEYNLILINDKGDKKTIQVTVLD